MDLDVKTRARLLIRYRPMIGEDFERARKQLWINVPNNDELDPAPETQPDLFGGKVKIGTKPATPRASAPTMPGQPEDDAATASGHAAPNPPKTRNTKRQSPPATRSTRTQTHPPLDHKGPQTMSYDNLDPTAYLRQMQTEAEQKFNDTVEDIKGLHVESNRDEVLARNMKRVVDNASKRRNPGLPHAANNRRPGMAILLTGPSGSGKTSTAQNCFLDNAAFPNYGSAAEWCPLIFVGAPAPCTLLQLAMRILTRLGYNSTRVIAQDQLVVVVSKTHRISDQRSIAFADVVGEPFVGLSDAALEAHLGERAARLGRQIYYRIQLRRIESVAMLVESGVGIAILSEASAKDLGHLGLAIVPLQDPWALRQLHLCARDFSALTPHAGLLAQQLMEPKVAIP